MRREAWQRQGGRLQLGTIRVHIHHTATCTEGSGRTVRLASDTRRQKTQGGRPQRDGEGGLADTSDRTRGREAGVVETEMQKQG